MAMAEGQWKEQSAEDMAGKRQFLSTFVLHLKQICLGFRER